MLLGFFALGVVALIMFGATRIVLGWIFPRATMAKVDTFVGRAMKLYVQITVVAFAGLIGWAFWLGSRGDEPSRPIDKGRSTIVQTAKAASDWNPPDPDQERTKVPFTLAFAKRLRAVHTLADLQKMAGSKGKITERTVPDRVGYHWISDPDRGLPGFMLVEAFRDGGLGISINPSDATGVVILNNFGNFDCGQCKPPIHICGERPSWIKSDERYC